MAESTFRTRPGSARVRRTAAIAALAAVAVLASACGSSSPSGSSPSGSSKTSGGASSTSAGGTNVKVGYFQSATIGPEVLVKGNADLASKVGGSISLIPIDSGVAGLAELRAGAFAFASGVGNPPVVGAIANNTDLKVIYAEYYDAAQLIVGSDIKQNSDLAGKTVGDLQGSSEDFEIRGWLSKQGLTNKVKVVGFPSEQAVEAAYKSGSIAAGYVEIAQAQDLLKNKSNRIVVTAQQIAKEGFASLNVLAVTNSFASAHQQVVQNFVCQIMKAQSLVGGAQGDTYITNGSKLVGATPATAIAATKGLPFVSAQDQLTWFGTGSNPTNSAIAKSYALTGQFLKQQGRVTTVPSAATIASHIDPTYVQKALADKCEG